MTLRKRRRTALLLEDFRLPSLAGFVTLLLLFALCSSAIAENSREVIPVPPEADLDSGPEPAPSANIGFGPLRVNSQSPFGSLRLSLLPRTLNILGGGRTELSAQAAWVNLWNPSLPESFIDYEMLQTNVGIAYGFSDRFQGQINFETRSRFGGKLDHPIQEFHDTFDIDQNGRDLWPKDSFTFELYPSGDRPAVVLTDDDRGLFTRSVLVTLQHNVTAGTARRPAFAYGVTARKEVSDSGDLEGGGTVDFGVSAAASKRVQNVYLYGTLGYVWFGRKRFHDLELGDEQFSALAGLEWRIFPRFALVFQYLASEGVAKHLKDYTDYSHEVVFGVISELTKGMILEFGFIEDIIANGNSADFGMHLAIRYRL